MQSYSICPFLCSLFHSVISSSFTHVAEFPFTWILNSPEICLPNQEMIILLSYYTYSPLAKMPYEKNGLSFLGPLIYCSPPFPLCYLSPPVFTFFLAFLDSRVYYKHHFLVAALRSFAFYQLLLTTPEPSITPIIHLP